MNEPALKRMKTTHAQSDQMIMSQEETKRLKDDNDQMKREIEQLRRINRDKETEVEKNSSLLKIFDSRWKDV